MFNQYSLKEFQGTKIMCLIEISVKMKGINNRNPQLEHQEIKHY
jgi:hypothetical protein